jgi:hypothetical protein
MKNLIFIIAFFICNLSFGQVVDIQSVENVDIVKLLNNLESFSENKTEDLSIRVYMLGNESGSAGFESGEVTHKLHFAVALISTAALCASSKPVPKSFLCNSSSFGHL